MKKILIIVIAAVLMFSLFGCARNLEDQVNELVEQKLEEMGEENSNDDSSDENEDEDVQGADEEDLDSEDDMDNEGASNDEEDSDSGYNWDSLDGASVPEGYPGDMVPLVGVDSAVILGSAKQQMGAEGTSYVIIFGLDEPYEDVAEAIQQELEPHILNAGGTFQAIMGQMFMGEVGKCKYTVAIGDGAEEGYKTTVDYTVIVTN